MSADINSVSGITADGFRNEMNLRVQIWPEFPVERDQNMFWIARKSFYAMQWEDSAKNHPEVGFLALLIDDGSTGPSRSHVIAVAPCDLVPSENTPSDMATVYGETWTVQNLNLPSDVCMSVVIGQPINLSRIIVAVRCSETRRVIEEHLVNRSILQDVHSHSVIINQGSTFMRRNSDAVVLKCEPVQQGLLGIGTEVVISELSHGSRNSGPGRTSKSGSSLYHRNSLSVSSLPSGTGKRPDASLKALELYERALKFASTFLGSSKSIPVRKLALSASQELLRTVADTFTVGSRFSVSVLLQPLQRKPDASFRTVSSLTVLHERDEGHQSDPGMLNGSFDPAHSVHSSGVDMVDFSKDFQVQDPYSAVNLEDEDSVVTVSQNSYERLTQRGQQWFWVSSHDSRLSARLVHLSSLSWTLDEDDLPGSDTDALVNPVLWFNMNKHPSSLVQSAVAINLSPATSPPEYFHTIRISVVRSPGIADDDVERWYPLVEERFAVPRIVRKDDILVIHAPQSLSIDSGRQSICFKVTDVEPAHILCGLATKSRTFLFLCGIMSSYVPAAMDRFLRQPIRHSLFDSLYSSVFMEPVTQFVALLSAYAQGGHEHSHRTPAVLLHGDRGSGKQTIVCGLALQLNMQVYEINVAKSIVSDTAAAMEARLQNQTEKAALFTPCIVVFRHLDYLVESKDEPRLWKALDTAVRALTDVSGVIVIGTCSCKPSAPLEDTFSVLSEIPRVTTSDRVQLLREFVDGMNGRASCDVDIPAIADRAAAFTLSDMMVLFENSQVEAVQRVRAKSFPGHTSVDLRSEDTLRLSGVCVEQCDFLAALHRMLKTQCAKYGSLIDTSVTWEDIGGLEDAKREILRTIELPLSCSQIRSSGLQRLGILLCGPPGNGKTLLAKTVAAQCSLNFISVKGPELINMYVGQSEENVRSVFERARLAAPCIIFFDEIDSLAPKRGRSGDSGGVIDRVVSQLMTEMDGLSRNSRIFVFGATNRPDLIDSALLRPGRFDKIIEVGHPTTAEERRNVLQAVLRKCQLGPACDLGEIEQRLPPKVSGADLYAACAFAQLRAISRLIGEGRLSDIPVIEPEDFVVDDV